MFISSRTSKHSSTQIQPHSYPPTLSLPSPPSLQIIEMDTLALPAGSKLSTFQVENQSPHTTLQVSKEFFQRDQGIHEFTVALCRQHDHARRSREAPDPTPEVVNFLYQIQVRSVHGFGHVADRLVGEVCQSHKALYLIMSDYRRWNRLP